jgi:hypothetical protein
MAHASTPAEIAKPLRDARGFLTFHVGDYEYELGETEKGPIYSVRDGVQSLSVPLLWAFGNDEVGQTYVYERNGTFHESRVSYYRSLQALDFTTGNPRSAHDSLCKSDHSGRRLRD